jgi:hypothetical protein
MAAGKASAKEPTADSRETAARLSATEQGWVVEWARELEYQYGPASRARRLAQAVADLLADWPDGA